MIIAMGWCANTDTGCPRPDNFIEEDQHVFSGYGFYLVYHPECCPLHFDGMSCTSEHPKQMAPNSYRGSPPAGD